MCTIEISKNQNHVIKYCISMLMLVLNIHPSSLFILPVLAGTLMDRDCPETIPGFSLL